MSLQTPTPIPDPSRPLPSLSSMGTWAQDMQEMHRWMREDLGPGTELLAEQTYINAQLSSDAGLASIAAANFKGQWSDLIGAISVPSAVWHDSKVWALLVDLADVTTSEPGVSLDWVDIGGVRRSGDTMSGPLAVPAGASGAQVPQAQETALLASTQLGYRNKVVNGNFEINQDGVSGTVILAAGFYGHDQWKAGASGCTYTFAQSNGITTVTITAGSLIQILDGENLFPGTHVMSWSGTSQGKIGAGSYGASGQTYSVTGGSNLNIEFGTGTLSIVQFERGTKPSLFEHMSPAQHFMRCAEFYYKGTAYWTGYAVNAARAGYVVKFPTRMRATPIIANQNATVANGFPSTAFVPYGLTRDGFTADLIANSTVVDGRWSQTFSANARLT